MINDIRLCWLRRVGLALAAAGLAAGIGSARAETLVIPGSGNPEYVLRQLASAFNAQQGKHQVSIPTSSGSAGALRDVEQGVSALGRVGRPLKDAERARGLSYIGFGRDAVVFVAGAAVSARSIGASQAFDIYAGRLSDWRDLGGRPGPIRAVGRESTDASRQAIGRELKGFGEMQFHNAVKLVHLDPQMLDLLDRYPTSLGFMNRSGLAAAKTTLVPLALDGIEATLDNLTSGRYPIWLEFGFVHKNGALDGAAQAFVAFVQSPSGERILREHGVMPLVGPN